MLAATGRLRIHTHSVGEWGGEGQRGSWESGRMKGERGVEGNGLVGRGGAREGQIGDCESHCEGQDDMRHAAIDSSSHSLNGGLGDVGSANLAAQSPANPHCLSHPSSSYLSCSPPLPPPPFCTYVSPDPFSSVHTSNPQVADVIPEAVSPEWRKGALDGFNFSPPSPSPPSTLSLSPSSVSSLATASPGEGAGSGGQPAGGCGTRTAGALVSVSR